MKAKAEDINRYTNLDYMRLRTKSDLKLMEEMIMVYLNQIPALILIMNQSVADKDYTLLQATIHKMIPSFSIVGMGIGYENMAKMLQDCAINHDETGQIAVLAKKLADICSQACAELKDELNNIIKQKR